MLGKGKNETCRKKEVIGNGEGPHATRTTTRINRSKSIIGNKSSKIEIMRLDIGTSS